MIERLIRFRFGGILRECDGLVDLTIDLCSQFLLPLIRPEVSRCEVKLHRWNGIARFPVLNLGRITIFGGINLRMTVPAVGLAFEQCRSAARARPIDGLAHRGVHGHDIVSIDRDARNPVARSFRTQVLDR